MPMILQPLDELARQKGRNILVVLFPKLEALESSYDRYKPRTQFIRFLKAHGIPWTPCCWPSNPQSVFDGYTGMIYLDVPFEEGHPQYELLRDHLENADGTPKNKNVCFHFYSLQKALDRVTHEVQLDPEKK